jgi:hypothetical protein
MLKINHAIATLVSAFAVDPVARWMYHAPDQYLLHVPRLFRALGASSFEAGAAHPIGAIGHKYPQRSRKLSCR